MTQIDLFGLHHFDEIGTNKTLAADLQKPGVYIWGFLAKKLNGENSYEIIDAPTFRNGHENKLEEGYCFIPYYVGESSKSILKRLNMHHQPTLNDASKYTRITNGHFQGEINKNISFGGYHGYFKKVLRSKEDPFNLVKQVHYNNDCIFLKMHLSSSYTQPLPEPEPPKSKMPNYPITKQNEKGENFKDILNEYIDLKKNFYFLYTNIEPVETKNIEAILYFLLKGYTIGKAKSLKKLSNIQYNINTNITFPHNSIFKASISSVFPGF